jgi:hypothetical protein
MYHGKAGRDYLLSVESAALTRGPEQTINRLCKAVEALPKEARKLWDGCSARTLDMGFDSGTTGDPRKSCFQVELSSSTLIRAAKLGMGITVTIYPLELTGHRKLKGRLNKKKQLSRRVS